MSVLNERFPAVAEDAKGHVALCYYAAVACLVDFVMHQANGAGADIEGLYARYAFLGRYHETVLEPLPEGAEAGRWWREAVDEWARDIVGFLPLCAIRDAADLSEDSAFALMLLGLAEEDPRFGGLFADLQEPLRQRRPTLELVSEILSNSSSDTEPVDAWGVCRPLFDAGLVTIQNDHVSRPEWVLQVPSVIWDALRGERVSRSLGQLRMAGDAVELASLVYPAPFIAQLKNTSILPTDATFALTMRAGAGDDDEEIAASIARSRGKDLLVVDAAALDQATQRLLGPACTLSGAMPLIRYESTPGTSVQSVRLWGYRDLYCQSLGHSGGLESGKQQRGVTIEVPRLSRVLRLERWQAALGGQPVCGLLADRFQFGARQIKDVAALAVDLAGLDGRKQVEVDDVRHANRQICRQRLETLADHIETTASWADFISNTSTTDQLLELQQRCLHREPLADAVEFADKRIGVCALLAGPSGTGKTFASKLLAAELGMDIYRINLSGIVNKFLGETEKNLHRVFTQAEAADVILLLDEGDALLGSRTDVKSSNDRYANLETNFLLQQLEQFNGIVLVTTNRPDNIDTAFQRRMDAIVNFTRPQTPDERLDLWRVHLPPNHVVDPDYLHRVARRCMLHGGQIRNVALLAALLALETGGRLGTWQLDQALRREYTKAGALFPLVRRDRDARRALDADTLANALEVL